MLWLAIAAGLFLHATGLHDSQWPFGQPTPGSAQGWSLFPQKSKPASKSHGLYWPHARGEVGRYSFTEHSAPQDLAAHLAWSWHHPDGRYHTVVVGGPLIDGHKNLYLASEDGVRKFHENGTQGWFYKPRGPLVNCPSLHAGSLFGNTVNGWVFALDMDTGKERWAQQKAREIGSDTAYVEAHDGVVISGMEPSPNGGATKLMGMSTQDGKTLWEYTPDTTLWNVMPIFHHDAFVVMDIHGGVHKHALKTATLLWYVPPPSVSANTFSDGGVMLGPDGTAYSCSNFEGTGQQGQQGALRAYRSQDGKLLWDRFLEKPCNSWPVVTPDGKNVIVPTGAFVASPAASNYQLMMRYQVDATKMQQWSLALGDQELRTYGMPDKTAAVQAFNTRTGELQWSTELPPYGRMAAKGDEEGLLERRMLQHREQCLPAQFASPTLSGDGAVYVPRADGRLYVVESSGRFHSVDVQAGSLHPGTSWAPGMMALATCDGLFVWKF